MWLGRGARIDGGGKQVDKKWKAGRRAVKQQSVSAKAGGRAGLLDRDLAGQQQPASQPAPQHPAPRGKGPAHQRLPPAGGGSVGTQAGRQAARSQAGGQAGKRAAAARGLKARQGSSGEWQSVGKRQVGRESCRPQRPTAVAPGRGTQPGRAGKPPHVMDASLATCGQMLSGAATSCSNSSSARSHAYDRTSRPVGDRRPCRVVCGCVYVAVRGHRER